MRTTDSDLKNLLTALQTQMPDGEWEKVLTAFVPTGVVDGMQLRQTTGMHRSRLDRVMDKLHAASAGLPPLFHIVDQKLERPGIHGRQPTVFMVDETGAALLRLMGYANIHACRLNNGRAITHALAMVDVHQTAVRSQINIVTDQTIPYADGQTLRPDHVITMEDGRQLIVEVEQSIDSGLLPRITESIKHKVAFFQSSAAEAFVPEVRMVINLPRGTAFEKTAALWKRVIALHGSNGQALPFRLLVMSLNEFTVRPDWNLDTDTWRDLTTEEPEITDDTHAYWLPQLPERNPEDDADLLTGLWFEYVTEHQNDPQPSLDFVRPLQKIYLSSKSQKLNSTRLSPPIGAIYLLNRYLELHPKLVERLRAEMHRGHGKIRWTQQMVMHRMQAVINEYLLYFGVGNGDGIRVEPRLSSVWDEVPTQFAVSVKLAVESPVPYTDVSLAWVLWALFEYSDELGLGSLEYW